jgi:hypothetical protein
MMMHSLLMMKRRRTGGQRYGGSQAMTLASEWAAFLQDCYASTFHPSNGLACGSSITVPQAAPGQGDATAPSLSLPDHVIPP